MQFQTPQFWTKKNLLSFLLLPLSWIYFLVSLLLRKKSYKISKPVICVGNLIAGGSGKTPTAIALGKILREITIKGNFEFAFLSAGYMGDGAKFVLLNEGKHVAKNVGDEPMLLTQTALTFVAKDRLFGAKQIDNIKKIKAIILDDGMQNNSLHKDLTIAVVDGKIAFGNGFMIPAGPMREPLKLGLKKADFVVVIGEMTPDLEKKLSGKKIVLARLITKNLAEFSGKKLLAFCGLAYPQKFFTFLKDSDLEVLQEKSFPDHYNYKIEDLDSICKIAHLKGLDLITTKKDWVKFPPIFQEKIAYLDVELEFVDQEFVAQELRKIVG
ncbi:MAG: tetraacyldisaccharide 4'-kinase [Rickettsiales bacterium]|nr:tetraacyldisaccharide 4'-kinase [Rickettsiales bacterium]